ncbi:MAG TPA: GNAT family N-acetyltransferase [Balneolaceae bacterium]|nr:GNAT family N-acetyltransferase [Balneolaceae bacterium]
MNEIISTDISDCYLRFADENDVPMILEFINELAKYEKMAHEVVATEYLLREKLFGDRRYAEVVLAYYQDTPAGFALFFHNFSTFMGRPGIYLEDLFVKEEYRGNGIGTTLLSFLAKLAIERDCARLDWAVLDWNTPSIEFYKSLNAKHLDDWMTFRVTGDPLSDLAERFS